MKSSSKQVSDAYRNKPFRIVLGAAVFLSLVFALPFGTDALGAQGGYADLQNGAQQNATEENREDNGSREELPETVQETSTSASQGSPAANALVPFATEDETAPVFGAITITPEYLVEAGTLYSSETVVIIAEVSDPESAEDEDELVPGIDPDAIIVTVDGQENTISNPVNVSRIYYDAKTESTPERIRIEFDPKENDTLQYSLEDIEITIKDRAGNRTLSGKLNTLGIEGKDGNDLDVAITSFIINAKPAMVTIEYDNNNPYNNTNYYDAARTVTIEITSPGFVRARASAKYKEKSVVTIESQSVEGTPTTTTYSYEELTGGDNNTWFCEHEFAEDGRYQVTVKLNNPYMKHYTSNETEFYIDTHQPTIESATLTPTEPVVWDWIVSDDKVELVFALQDNFTGIDPTSILATIGGQAVPAVYDSAPGTLTLTFDGDNQRILLDDIDLVVYDLAHNESPPLNLRELLGASVSPDTSGFIVDKVAPAIAVSYDNNDPQNSSYYNAERTASFTIEEETLDLIQANEPYRTIVSIIRDGATSILQAKDFTSQDGRTWTAMYPFDTDGDYTLDASLKDIAGNASNKITDSFIIDLTKPSVMLTFDNNEAQGGMYFKAPRTAILSIAEKNFSESLVSVVVSAEDASGAGAAAPGISGWSQAKPGVWEATIPFNQELHYSLTVGCTDLAGNAAEEVKEPEFVIDMTMPVVRVEQVQNKTAYAQELSPRVYFEDINFEPYLAKVEITGSNEEQSVYLNHEEVLTNTSRAVTYADIPYELRYDDVYTLTAQVEDRAGNTAEETITFSVNRFGSNYELSTATESAVGAYLQKPQEIVVIETNVSGLESSLARLAHNDSMGNLTSGEDYVTNTLGSQAGWSRYEYVFPAGLFEDDGYYRLLLSSEDSAGNFSDNLMMGKNITRDGACEITFAVDGTSPLAHLGSINNGATFFEPSHVIEVFADDNLEVEEATLYINDVPEQTWAADELISGAMLFHELPASDVSHTVRLEVRDRAGNVTSLEMNDVLVTNDILRYVANTPTILYPLTAALSVLVALGAVLVVRLIRKSLIAKKAAAQSQT